ncbi:YhgE/Pip domain-containing protein [Streptomyces sp. WMMC897]|uniref:YhgE/Pip domain-containing protein n=1 Tax=Streptomyces sp. WMMC897 TaxID=3014782 RepID=UPI0022B74C49|nr:YhgE/Pip domain-containing protein [Streptomyces sp. WMMC897]MCZ7413790.1 YhgE/Pip domain-containing protein [Streptomyces sp. WMMC897]
MRSPRLAALELRRFGRGRLPRAALVTVMLLPLLYGALYLWSFWDPYERLDRIPVALVNEDAGTTVESPADGGAREITAGDDLSRALHDSETFDWRETTAEDAAEGVEEGRYFLSLTIPEEFSTKVTSSSGDRPETGALRVRTNDANNYIVGQIARTVFSEVRAAASSRTSRGFYDNIFIAFSAIHDATQDAADGAGDLKDGIDEAKDGSGDLKDGASRAEDGGEDLADGVGRLDRGAGRLEDGAEKVADGTRKLADKVNGIADAVVPFTEERGEDIAKAAGTVAEGAEAARKHLDSLPGDAARAARLADAAADGTEGLHRLLCVPGTPEGPDGGGLPDLLPGEPSLPQWPGLPQPGTSEDADGGTEGGPDGGTGGPSPGAATAPALSDEHCADLGRYAEYSRGAADAADDVKERIDGYESLDDLGDDLDKLRDVALKVQKRAPHLDDDLRLAVKQVNALNDGAKKVHDGSEELHDGLTKAAGGAGRLESGLVELSDGADLLDGGMIKLADGSLRLADGLRDGVKQIPDYGDEERADRSAVMADPVELASRNLHAAPNYGTGFAPYFIPLALWVGAMVAYMLLPALNRRALAAGAPAVRTALAAWLPVAAVGAVQASVLLAVLRWAPGLGLELARPAGTLAFLLLVSACFTAIVQWLNAQFGPSGRIMVLVLLMLQLTSAGGTYPVQTSPGFFNAVHPFLPMTYVVEGLRHLVTGGGLGPVWQGVAVLLGFTAAALAATAWTARRGSVWTLKRLHPELTL